VLAAGAVDQCDGDAGVGQQLAEQQPGRTRADDPDLDPDAPSLPATFWRSITGGPRRASAAIAAPPRVKPWSINCFHEIK
jgi:hypothetical protein